MSTVAADRRTDPPRLRPVRTRVRVAWLLAGVLLIAGSALGFGVVAQQLADRRPVVVLGRPLERGSVVAASDLAVAQVAADASVSILPARDSGQLVGRVLLTSLPAGSLMTPDLLGPAGLELRAGSRIVGIELGPGGYPTSTLAAGDAVSVVRTDSSGALLTDDAVVLGLEPTAEGATTMLVSVVVDTATATRVASAAAQGDVRLLLHGAGR